MSTLTLEKAVRARHDATAALPREVIATVVQRHGRIALFKRSQSVGHERGLWHCITGYLEPNATPEQQVLAELQEEAGLLPQDLADLQHGEQLLIPDHTGNPWLVHTFTVTSQRRRLMINDEHDAYRWTVPSKITRFTNRVPWLDAVIQAAPPVTSRKSHQW